MADIDPKKTQPTGSVGTPIVKPGVEEMEIPVTIRAPGAIDPNTHPFILIQRFVGNNLKGKVEMLEPGQAIVSDDNGSILRLLQRQPILSAENTWIFSARTKPGQGVLLKVFASFDETKLQPKFPNNSLLIGQTGVFSLPPTKMNKAPSVDQALTVGPMPRLSVGINLANPPELRENGFVGTATLAMQHDPKTIGQIVMSVMERVKQPLDAIWESQKAMKVPSILDFPETTLGVAQANEFWARVITEMLAFTPYGGPTVTYMTGKNPDFLFANLSPSAENKFYGLSFACENLATIVAASRGTATFKDFGLEAGSVSTRITTDVGGKWLVAVPAQDNPNGPPVLQILQNPDGKAQSIPRFGSVVDVTRFGEQETDEAYFGPGSVLLFCNRIPKAPSPKAFDDIVNDTSSQPGTVSACRVEGGIEMCAKRKDGKLEITGPFPVIKAFVPKAGAAPEPPPDPAALLADHTAGCHIGPVIRISADRKQIQTFDTGGLGVGGRGSDLITVMGTGSGFHSGNMDDALTSTVKNGGGEPFRGVGAFKRIREADLPKFVTQIQALLEARPLGFVRFALIDAGKKLDYKNVVKPSAGWLKFLSPLRPMYGAEKSQNFSIARYLWSLRNMPAFDQGLEGWWFFYVPRGRLARAMMADKDRAKSPFDLAEEAVSSGPRNKEWNNKDGSLNVPRILRDMTLPILNAKSTSEGKIRITNNNLNQYGKMSRIHYAEGNWSGAQLPMDKFFMFTKGVDETIFPPELVPKGTLQMDIV